MKTSVVVAIAIAGCNHGVDTTPDADTMHAQGCDDRVAASVEAPLSFDTGSPPNTTHTNVTVYTQDFFGHPCSMTPVVSDHHIDLTPPRGGRVTISDYSRVCGVDGCGDLTFVQTWIDVADGDHFVWSGADTIDVPVQVTFGPDAGATGYNQRVACDETTTSGDSPSAPGTVTLHLGCRADAKVVAYVRATHASGDRVAVSEAVPVDPSGTTVVVGAWADGVPASILLAGGQARGEIYAGPSADTRITVTEAISLGATRPIPSTWTVRGGVVATDGAMLHVYKAFHVGPPGPITFAVGELPQSVDAQLIAIGSSRAVDWTSSNAASDATVTATMTWQPTQPRSYVSWRVTAPALESRLDFFDPVTIGLPAFEGEHLDRVELDRPGEPETVSVMCGSACGD
ncbi:MAG TPA: hypothetical protein VL463_19910 [Kofleriaceae bacterium]|nr:hypothetical protein [Kofleriaceae bacterium]